MEEIYEATKYCFDDDCRVTLMVFPNIETIGFIEWSSEDDRIVRNE